MVETQTNKNLVLWGHALRDYVDMRLLSEVDASKKILDCYPGPSSVAAELHQQGRDIIACDKLYGLSDTALREQINDNFQAMLTKVRGAQDHFIWEHVDSLDKLAATRQTGINTFLKDFDEGKAQGRYVNYDLTQLPYDDFTFELALCSHYLFTSRLPHDLNLHAASVMEMARVAHEVRIFPLLDCEGEISELVGPLMLTLQQNNYGVEVKQVPYQFQQQGNALLRVWAQECQLKDE